MSEEFKSEEAIVENFKEHGYELRKMENSSENFSFYDSRDIDYQEDATVGFFKDSKGNWHDLHFGQWYHYDNDSYDAEVEKRYLEALRTEHHIMDNEGHIYYIKEGATAEDTGFRRSFSGSHLDSAYLFKDSFVIDSKNDVIGDPDHDVYGAENITKNKLYKRQEDGSYKQIWESRDCIFQKIGFPENVYFSGGSWRHPKAETYFIYGKVDAKTQQKIDIIMKLEHIKSQKDLLQEKQDAIASAINTSHYVVSEENNILQNVKVHEQNGLDNTGDNDMGEVPPLVIDSDKVVKRLKEVGLGKTGDSKTGEIRPEHIKVANVQKEEAKKHVPEHIVKKLKERKNQLGS